jgi:hypothetical protein
MNKRRNCGRCHVCGEKLQPVLDGEEWCASCDKYVRYQAHGWAASHADPGHSRCPEWAAIEGEYQEWLDAHEAPTLVAW